jgi:hypothetical protein
MKIDLGNKKVTIRKWKGKDKKLFKKLMSDENTTQTDIMKTLVYNCIEENVVLSVDEFRYVLSRIRSYSLGDRLYMEFLCDNCGEISTNEYEISKVIRPNNSTLDRIKIGEIDIRFGEIRNMETYLKYIQEDELFDMILRVKSINGDDSFTMESLIDFFDEMDVDVIESIMIKFHNDKFTVDDVNTIKCKNCANESLFKFDELPNFFPESWFK